MGRGNQMEAEGAGRGAMKAPRWASTAVLGTLALSCAGRQTPLLERPRAARAPVHRQGSASPGSVGLRERVDAAASLPLEVADWRRAGIPKRIDADGIFDYMDGAGEMYLAYRFDHLDVVEYVADRGGSITVELYVMEDADDAFGLLSMDWGGEVVEFGGVAATTGGPGEWPRALYGAGLLRVWSGSVYARIMAVEESEASRQAVLTLGRAVMAGNPTPAPPALVAGLPEMVGQGWRQRRDSVCFLRSHLVLNAAYFMSQQDILSLGLETEAVTVRYDLAAPGEPPVRVRLVLVCYADSHRARQAAARCRQAYLPESQRGQAIEEAALVAIEDGWAGLQVSGSCLVLVLGCPDRDTAVSFVRAGREALAPVGGGHE